jgi:uncharacterized protein
MQEPLRVIFFVTFGGGICFAANVVKKPAENAGKKRLRNNIRIATIRKRSELMRQDILDKIRFLKNKYDPQGFIVIGVFGSFARGDETEKSDIDILYDCSDSLFNRYSGWDFFGFYEEVKADFERELGRKVDLADRKALNRIGEKYILPEVVHVS